MNLSTFDICQYLENRNISYSDKGKNIASGWIGTTCVFCDDQSTHLGINLQSNAYNCLKCGEKGNILHLIQEIDQVPIPKAIQIFYQFQGTTLSYLDEPIHHQPPSQIQLPKGASKNFAGVFTNYLLGRKFNPSQIIRDYDLYCCHTIGDFKFRLIIPVYFNDQCVTFTSRDVTNKAIIPYCHCPIEKSIIPIKETLYNIDSVKDKAVVVEGVTDVWRLGEGCVATFGTKYTKEQLVLLSSVKKIYILYDSDAKEQSEKLGNDLSCFINEVEILYLDEGDPANMDQFEALKLMKYLGF